jgi:hypothetical protein
VGLTLGVEQDGSGQRRLKDSIGELATEAHGQQPPKIRPLPQVTGDFGIRYREWHSATVA